MLSEKFAVSQLFPARRILKASIKMGTGGSGGGVYFRPRRDLSGKWANPAC